MTSPVAAIGTAPEDASLVRSALGGETRVFEKLVELHCESVHLIAFARMGNRETAEDLAQEVFLRAFLGLRQLRDPALFAAWVNQITRNLALNWIRQRQRTSRLVPMVPMEQLSQEIPDTEARDPREGLTTGEQEAAVREAIGTLEPEQREVVLLHFAQGLSKSEIAHRLGTHPSTIGRGASTAPCDPCAPAWRPSCVRPPPQCAPRSRQCSAHWRSSAPWARCPPQPGPLLPRQPATCLCSEALWERRRAPPGRSPPSANGASASRGPQPPLSPRRR
ncbi:sigma-70 family RNA polymerase sigma factor [Candidatus Sumerlaeota bacterium]|nr:sigma-70 family RNA polymerase sigma factor [Candidatus Sumerlaeota bacterium]